MATIYGGNANSYWRTRVDYSVSSPANSSYTTITATVYINSIKDCKPDMGQCRPIYLSCNGVTQNFYPTGEKSLPKGNSYNCGSKTFTIPRTTSAKSVTLTGYIKKTAGLTALKGSSTASVSISCPALSKYTIAYANNAGESAGNMPPSQTKWFGINTTLSTKVPTLEGFAFKDWVSGGTHYSKGATYTANAGITLRPTWQPVDPPTLDVGELTDVSGYSSVIGGFTEMQIDVSNVRAYHSRSISSIVLKAGNVTSSAITEDGTLSLTVQGTGEQDCKVVVTDSAGAVNEYPCGSITVTSPIWDRVVEADKDTYPVPDINQQGHAIIIVEAKNNSNAWVEIEQDYIVTETDTTWSINVPLSAEYVSDDTLIEPTSTVRVSYTHTDEETKESRKAFYSTTRNQNFSNGISNIQFVGGCELHKYGTRVWWSDINNPLYFPDTNYVEVGSNDTDVMGLTKVGDYLGVVKQSKTTDTAIFLLYPTSFDDDTTYAVKQGVQGVGAIGKYSFNMLGAETLFLSPQGVMAIVPSDDEEHKVQNRSFFIDGKLLAESELASSYSFVFDGKYWLSVNNKCYVLDGNQRNSWGNDRTNLVYEAYYLENVPANCFMKYGDELWFSNENDVCRVKTKFDSSPFVDAYDDEGNTDVPVFAEWSTALDDDGTIHYLKTMQKKGNVVSALPIDDDNYVLGYVEAYPTEDEFNENKSAYYYIVDGVYVQCTDESVYDPTLQYYTYSSIGINTMVDVYVKKDDEEPVFIGTINGGVEETGDIPNELFVNKKIKKYKRLQFIMRSNYPYGFGIDSIVKQFIIGNYAKK